MEKRNSGRSGSSGSAGEEVVVLLVRRKDKGKQPLGQHEQAGNDRASGALLPERVGDGETLELSQSEKFLIYRRRHNLSQSDMAKRFNMKRRRYSEFESGDGTAVGIEPPSVDPLEPHEKCFIYRRRSGWTQQECADLLQVARYWFMLMETGKAPCDRLEAFWNER